MEFLTALAATISLAVPGRTSATPSVAADGPFVAVAWSASDATGATDIFVAVSRDGARTFGPTVRANDIPGEARASGEQPPRLVLTRAAGEVPAITVVWTARSRSGTELTSARSEDGGRSFSASKALADTDAAGNRGWHNVTADASGRVYAVWLDHRELAQDESMPTTHHDHASAQKPDGVALAQKSKLYIESLDGALAPHAITGGVCYCCKTAVAADANGRLYAAWRHVYPGNLRDIAFARSLDGGRTFTQPARVSEDHWMIEGCPDDGPALAVGADERVDIVWPTLVSGEHGDEAIALFYASSRRGGAWSSRLRLPTEGIPHHAQIGFAPDGVVVAAWDESVRGTRRVVIARAQTRSGAAPHFVREIVSDGRASVYPAIGVSGAGTIVAWTMKSDTGSVIAVSTLPNR